MRLLGALRNCSVRAGRGAYVAQWDDDDWHAPTRLADQMSAIRETGRRGCVLLRWVIYDEATRSALLSEGRAWEGSVVAERTAVPAYAELRRGEDTPVIRRMQSERKLVFLHRPDLYVYVCHGANTCEQSHWEQNVFAFAQPLEEEDAERVRSLLMPR